MNTVDVVTEIAERTGGGVRFATAVMAMHGELASQTERVDWSDRPEELARLAVRYADALLAELPPLPEAGVSIT